MLFCFIILKEISYIKEESENEKNFIFCINFINKFYYDSTCIIRNKPQRPVADNQKNDTGKDSGAGEKK